MLFAGDWQTRAMGWSPDRNALRGRVAVVAGATRGAGRGIAAAGVNFYRTIKALNERNGNDC